MENLNDKITQLLNKAEWTDKEKQWLLNYLESTDSKELRNQMQLKFEDEKDQRGQVDLQTSKEMLQHILQETGNVKRVQKTRVIKMLIVKIAVASVAGLLILNFALRFKNETNKEIAKTRARKTLYTKDQSQVSNKVVLTLADGLAVVLDDKENGIVTEQGNTKVTKLNGKIIYNSTKENSRQFFYNTISTPAGADYRIELPDGSQVWLNAGSSLHFPTAFVGKERTVDMTGEAYFEIAKNVAMPFKVKVNGALVQVSGTHFNVMAYDDETALKTTLLEGKVKFVNGSYNCMLKPGQQTQLTKNGEVKLLSDVNVGEVVAWKNGMFEFDGAVLASVARQLSRWYDVEIVFDKRIHTLFYAKIPRNTDIVDVLKALELTGKVRFKIEDKKIIAMP